MHKSIAEAMIRGTEHHQAGQLAEAERCYRHVLSIEPHHAEALHYLGVLAMQAGDFESAVETIGRAIGHDPNQPAYHANLGEAYRHLNRLESAVACFAGAIQLAPLVAQFHAMLGRTLAAQGKSAEAVAALREALRLDADDHPSRRLLARALLDLGRPDEAEAGLRTLLSADAADATAETLLAEALGAQGRLAEAITAYTRALAFDPRSADAHNNLANLLNQSGRQQEAIEHLQAAVRLVPTHAAALFNLGLIYFHLDRHDDAVRSLRAAIEADPASPVAWYNLGYVLQAAGELDQSLDCYQQALTADPAYASAHCGAGSVLHMQGRLDEAVAACQRALCADPQSAQAYNNLGAALSEMGRRDQAVDALRRAIALDPRLAIAHSNLGIALQAVGLLDEAIAAHRRAVELAPTEPGLHSNLLYALNYHPGQTPGDLYEEHRLWGQRHADPLSPDRPAPVADPRPNRRLRLGYVSPYFMAHAVNFFVEPILASHDHDQFEVFCYSDVDHPDEATARSRSLADHWRDTRWLSNKKMCSLVRDDRIDILVDLTGHIGGGHRQGVFARRAAPVQVTYIGYQNTTGMKAMDYRLTDDYADPPGVTDRFHTERLCRLPTLFYCYQPSTNAPGITPLPALENGRVTFGSFNNFAKVTTPTLDAWASLLARVPNSRLVILADMTDSLQARLQATFAGRGISADRLQLVHRLPRAGYLDLINRVDVAVDPFPFNGHTTTCDCLWQGVPVVCCAGQTYVSRFGSSGLVVLGLQSLVASSLTRYVEIAADLAHDLPRLESLRSSLRARMAGSPLVNAAGFTRNLESAYRTMWTERCSSSRNAGSAH